MSASNTGKQRLCRAVAARSPSADNPGGLSLADTALYLRCAHMLQSITWPVIASNIVGISFELRWRPRLLCPAIASLAAAQHQQNLPVLIYARAIFFKQPQTI